MKKKVAALAVAAPLMLGLGVGVASAAEAPTTPSDSVSVASSGWKKIPSWKNKGWKATSASFETASDKEKAKKARDAAKKRAELRSASFEAVHNNKGWKKIPSWKANGVQA